MAGISPQTIVFGMVRIKVIQELHGLNSRKAYTVLHDQEKRKYWRSQNSQLNKKRMARIVLRQELLGMARIVVLLL